MAAHPQGGQHFSEQNHSHYPPQNKCSFYLFDVATETKKHNPKPALHKTPCSFVEVCEGTNQIIFQL